MTDFQHLLVTPDAGVARVTIQRPEKLNALNRQVLSELLRAVADLEATPEIRAVVLTGAGDKAFVAGADIKEMQDLGVGEAQRLAELGHTLGQALEASRMPIVAAVNGFALGGGCELALACDFIYASRTARFGQPEVQLGLIPGFGGTQRLRRRIGAAQARELIYTGELIDAERALSLGLVNRLCEPDQLLSDAHTTASRIAALAPLAVTASKRVIRAGLDTDLEVANELEGRTFAGLFESADAKEGMAAFVEKRRPRFEGR